MGTDSSGYESAVLSESAKQAVREQLDRLLSNTHFSHSKRFPHFLRFVVEHTLAGETELIKERTLGIEIFGRNAEYDTASDPIVRVTAAEIRKRVAQYYQEPEHAEELRIALPAGAYIPQFSVPNGADSYTLDVVEAAGRDPVEVSAPRGIVVHRRHLALIVALAVTGAALLTAGGIFAWQRMHRSALDFFWSPVTSSSEPALLCVADQLQYSGIVLRDAADPSRQIELKDNLTAVVMDDLHATIKVAGILQSNRKPYSLKAEGATNLEDLRSGPTIFIGAFDNAWTLRLTNALRYHFGNDPQMTQFRIVDSTTPGQSRWIVDRHVQMTTNNYRDYAIVARFTDTNTGKLAIVAAGVGRGGTIAAGEFLTDPAQLAQLERADKDAGKKENMEVVLSTQIIDGEPGTPKIEATYFW